MAYWLYQMSTEYYSHGRYRTEVWEGIPVTNWGIGESKRRPTEVQPGDIVILSFARTGAPEPGIYGWGIITLFDKEVIDFHPSSPSDYLKMNPLWDDEISDIVGKYGDLLDEMGREKNGKPLRPLSRLPYPKEEIEKALKAALGIAKDEYLKNQLERALVFLEDFIPDDDVPKDPDKHFALWISRKDWKNAKVREWFADTMTEIFVRKYSNNYLIT